MQDLPLQVALVDHVRVDDADRAHAGGGQVVAGGRAEAAGADDQHLRVEQLELAFLPHFGNQHVAAVPLLLGRREVPRNHELEPAVLPGAETALEGGGVLEPHLGQRLGRKRRAIPRCAIGHDRSVMVRDILLDARLEVAAGDVDGPRDDPLLHLVLFPNVDHNRLGTAIP